jgi:hypothetical protein
MVNIRMCWLWFSGSWEVRTLTIRASPSIAAWVIGVHLFTYCADDHATLASHDGVMCRNRLIYTQAEFNERRWR